MLPAPWKYRILAGSLNCFDAIRMTDCAITFDHYLKRESEIQANLVKYVDTTLDLFEVILLLNENGIYNLRRFFFSQIRLKLNKTSSIWDKYMESCERNCNSKKMDSKVY